MAVVLVAGASRGQSFARDVLPVLAESCFKCHGPDERARKAKLRLDTRDGALAPRKNGAAVVPGDPDASALLHRIMAEETSTVMPPPASKKERLTAAQIDTLRRWIAAGAPYDRHWAFVTPELPPEPPVRDPRRVRNGIDAFVLARLDAEGLAPAPETSRETLARRVWLDLTGLPPAVEEIDAFLADPAPDAYERLVERALASPHHGEKMAVEWLDLARFADTFGYQADVDIDNSPWRDWVIRAFNENLPYDRFLTWQLAGDLLPGATRDQRLATAFNRLHRQTNEGGSIEEEFRAEYVADRVNTFGTAILGLTLECARCHDHKFDAVTQRDYYGLAAFFNSIDESGLYSHFTRATPTPALALRTEEEEARHGEALRRVAEAEAELAEARAVARSEPSGGIGTAPGGGTPTPLPAPVAAFPFESLEGGRTPDAVDASRSARLDDGPLPGEGRVGRAVVFSGDNAVIAEKCGEFRRIDPFSFALWVRPAEVAPRAVVFHRSRAWTDSGSRGYELLLEEGRPSFALVHFWPGNALRVRAADPLPAGTWTHLAVTYDGSSRAAGVRIYRDGVPMALETVRDGLTRDIVHRAEWGDADAGGIHLMLGARFRDNGFRGGAIDEFQVYDRDLEPDEVHAVFSIASLAPAAAAPDPGGAANRPEFATAPYRTIRVKLREARAAEAAFADAAPEIMTMRETAAPRPAYVLKRGAYDQPGAEVARGVPAAIHPFPEGAPRDRLGLARWVADPRHPLTARVAVNRVWRQHFGRGLVATADDFGVRGEAPTHPELLDWLARRFADSGFDLKALHRLILTSATYRQSSGADGALRARDPDNLLLARGPRRRLLAEEVRDSALAAGGLLVRRIGGKSVRPWQPAGVWEDAGTGKTYRPDRGEALWRRSLYTFWRRTAPPPDMLVFDAPTREICAAKRERTATPLQALVLMNAPPLLEAARVLAARLVREHPADAGARADAAFRRVLGRLPSAAEREVLVAYHDRQRERLVADTEAASKLLAVGEATRDPEAPAADTAATALVVSLLFNHESFTTRP